MNLSTNLSPSNPKIGTTSDDASAETLSNVVTKSDFNVILLYEQVKCFTKLKNTKKF